jgi:hypothetical protein
MATYFAQKSETKPAENQRAYVKPPRYDGKRPFEPFLKQFESCARTNQWDQEMMLAQLRAALDGSAQQILWDSPKCPKPSKSSQLSDKKGTSGRDAESQPSVTHVSEDPAKTNMVKVAVKRKYDRRVKPSKFQASDRIYLFKTKRRRGIQEKRSRQYEGPNIVLKQTGPVNLMVAKSPQSTPFCMHEEKIKPYRTLDSVVACDRTPEFDCDQMVDDAQTDTTINDKNEEPYVGTLVTDQDLFRDSRLRRNIKRPGWLSEDR